MLFLTEIRRAYLDLQFFMVVVVVVRLLNLVESYPLAEKRRKTIKTQSELD